MFPIRSPEDETPAERPASHTWEFKARFRHHAYGWKSQPAITRIKQAVAEIKKVAKRDPVLAGDGAVMFLERVSGAIEQVDGSSGSISSAVGRAIDDLVPIIGRAPADRPTREAWLERLWEAIQADEIPYLESLADHWGELCGSPDVASMWADRLMEGVTRAWGQDRRPGEYFKGTVCGLGALVVAGRHDEVLALLQAAPSPWWHYRRFGFQALVAQGRVEDALRYAESTGSNDGETEIARACEELLLSVGRVDEAYDRYALAANRTTTYLATFRAVTKKYPHKASREILDDLVKSTPGDEGKWFAAAKDCGLFEEAVALARSTPCDPKTLARAARDYALSEPAFAFQVGRLALHWLAQGYGYEVTGLDVLTAYDGADTAADSLGKRPELRGWVEELIALPGPNAGFIGQVLAHRLGRDRRSGGPTRPGGPGGHGGRPR